MAADGLIDPDLLYYVHNIHLQIPGAKLGSALEQVGKGGITFSQIFTDKNLIENGRIGQTVAKVRVDEKGKAKTIKAFNRVDCATSRFITSSEISNYGVEQAIKRACAATVTVPLPAGTAKLMTISSWPTISLTVTMPPKGGCLGICKNPLLIGIRLLFPRSDGIPWHSTTVEISPYVLRMSPSTISPDGKQWTFALSGQGILELSKSHFTATYGYHNRESFALTRGFLHGVYARLTARIEELKILDVVWTTNPSPPEATLMGAVSPKDRDSTTAFGSGEWCGFGDRDLCWYEFSVMKAASGVPTSR